MASLTYMKNRKIYLGALVIAIGGFLTKIAGAIYRVPLTALLGAEGLGVYQMAFPVYTLLLDLSSAGVPSALARVIAKNEHKKEDYLKKAIVLFGSLGIIATILMFLLSKPLAYFQGDVSSFYIYKVISPAVIFVALSACFKGYFQGQMKMYPTSLSQVFEQVVKIVVGLTIIYNADGIANKVMGAGFAIVVSEFFALIFLASIYVLKRRKNVVAFKRLDNFDMVTVSPKLTKKERFDEYKRLFYAVLPITLLSIIFPLSHIIDSSLIINSLKKFTDSAVKEYGLYSGAVMSIVNLPVTVCYGLAVVAIPVIAKNGKGKNNVKLLILSTLILSFLGAICVFAFSPLAVKILFPTLLQKEKTLTISLIKALSPSIILMAILQTTNSILIAKSKTKIPILSCLFGSTLKIIIAKILLKMPSVNIFAMPIAVFFCYLLACFINLLYIVKYADKENSSRKIHG